ncbi:MAG: response regulator [Burkholderiaceae bacterium]
MRLLVIEDDLELANGLVSALRQSHHAAEAVHTGQAAIAACSVTQYDLLILDLSLPDGDGLALMQRLRRLGLHAPVLILTARDHLQDRIKGLDAGADDYLAKPFALGELEARIRALARRGASSNSMLSFGTVEFDPATRELTVQGRPVAATARELAVLEQLLRKPGRVVSKHQMIESLYTWDQDVNPSMIEVFVSRLRRKLEQASAGIEIRALRGLGYRLEKATGA